MMNTKEQTGNINSIQQRTIRIIADDYGISPGVSRAIRLLAERERLSGTSCMTLFSDWNENARLLKAITTPVEIGLHLTLTDFDALSNQRQMPSLPKLIIELTQGILTQDILFEELDTQLQYFLSEMGMFPDFIDGHHHIHYLSPVRRWLKSRFQNMQRNQRPWLRAAPTLAGAPANVWSKIAFIKTLAAHFDAEMAQADFRVSGSLGGFYNWRSTRKYAPILSSFLTHLPDGAVIMCHPGHVDAVLKFRDSLTDARDKEASLLAGNTFPALLKAANCTLYRTI